MAETGTEAQVVTEIDKILNFMQSGMSAQRAVDRALDEEAVAHSRQREGVCSTCGGREINGRCGLCEMAL